MLSEFGLHIHIVTKYFLSAKYLNINYIPNVNTILSMYIDFARTVKINN